MSESKKRRAKIKTPKKVQRLDEEATQELSENLVEDKESDISLSEKSEDDCAAESSSDNESGDVNENSHASLKIVKDFYKFHFDPVIDEQMIGCISPLPRTNITLPSGRSCIVSNQISQSSSQLLFLIKASLLNAVSSVTSLADSDKEHLSIISHYEDVYYPLLDFDTLEMVRTIYTAHAIDHATKTKRIIQSHNFKLKTGSTGDFRDQGFTRPTVLILVPFRNSALRIVNIIRKLLTLRGKVAVGNKKRFLKEFSLEDDVEKGKKPIDYEMMFDGNTDDHFRVGLSIGKRSLKIFSSFYKSDIIIASPLGLKTVLDGLDEDGPDFLSSIGVLIIDQADVLLMQNWEHVLDIISKLNQLPKKDRGTDFARVRPWALNGHARYYRQSIIYSHIDAPEIMSVLTKHCYNYHGCYYYCRSVSPSIGQVIISSLRQTFYRFDASTIAKDPEQRFEYFTQKLMHQLQERTVSSGQMLIYVSSYFDYVRLRNYFKKNDLPGAGICEYTKTGELSKYRGLFYNGQIRYLLYTERLHFYRRFRIRGVRQVFFYQLPRFSHFYAEICNFLLEEQVKGNDAELSVAALYSQYDSHRLIDLLGHKQTDELLSSKDCIHLLNFD